MWKKVVDLHENPSPSQLVEAPQEEGSLAKGLENLGVEKCSTSIVEVEEVLTFSSKIEDKKASTSRIKGEELSISPSHEEGESATSKCLGSNTKGYTDFNY